MEDGNGGKEKKKQKGDLIQNCNLQFMYEIYLAKK